MAVRCLKQIGLNYRKVIYNDFHSDGLGVTWTNQPYIYSCFYIQWTLSGFQILVELWWRRCLILISSSVVLLSWAAWFCTGAVAWQYGGAAAVGGGWDTTGWFCDWGETGLIMSTFRYRLLLHVMYYAAFDTAGENLVQVKWWSWEILYQTQNYIQHSVALPGLTPNFSNWQKTRPKDSSM